MNFPEQSWFKSSYTGPNGGDCVEVNLARQDVAGIRDSKDRGGPALSVTREKFRALIDSVTSGNVADDC